jgi:hypothetical protein
MADLFHPGIETALGNSVSNAYEPFETHLNHLKRT